jgi:hypothetical protein
MTENIGGGNPSTSSPTVPIHSETNITRNSDEMPT